MGALTFTINPDAVLTSAAVKPKTTRNTLWESQNKSRGRGWGAGLGLPNNNKGIETAKAIPAIKSTPHEVSIPLLPCPGNAIMRVRHSSYKQYLISTTLRLNGTWVASYGLPGTFSKATNAEDQAVAETVPFLAETLALADARLEIDDRKKPPRDPRVYKRRNAHSRRRNERTTKARLDLPDEEYAAQTHEAPASCESDDIKVCVNDILNDPDGVISGHVNGIQVVKS